MLLSLKYNFLFVHIAKTGGTSVRDSLRPLRFRDPWYPVQFLCSRLSALSGHRLGIKFPRHSKIIAAKEMLPEETFAHQRAADPGLESDHAAAGPAVQPDGGLSGHLPRSRSAGAHASIAPDSGERGSTRPLRGPADPPRARERTDAADANPAPENRWSGNSLGRTRGC